MPQSFQTEDGGRLNPANHNHRGEVLFADTVQMRIGTEKDRIIDKCGCCQSTTVQFVDGE
jgi:hypothetical protein